MNADQRYADDVEEQKVD